MAEPTPQSDDALLMDYLRGSTDEFQLPGKGLTQEELESALEFQLPGEGLTQEELEKVATIPEPGYKPVGDVTTGFEIDQVKAELQMDLKEALEWNYPNAGEDKINSMVDEYMFSADQWPRHAAAEPPEPPSVDSVRSFVDANPQYSGGASFRDVMAAVNKDADDDEIEKLIGKVPLYGFPEDVREGQGILAGFGRSLGRRLISTSGQIDLKSAQARQQHQRNATREMDEILQRYGKMEAFRKTWNNTATDMTEEEAKKAGVVSESDEGKKRQEFWSWEDDDILPAGIKDIPALIERGVTKLGFGTLFAPLLLDDEDYEQYKKEYRTAVPTENWEVVVRSVWNARDMGKTEPDIKRELQTELYRGLMANAYQDLPTGFLLGQPSLERLARILEQDPELAQDSNRPGLALIADMIEAGESEKEVQKELNKINYGQLPTAVWGGTVRSSERVVDAIYDSALKSITAIKDTGGVASRELQKDFQDLVYTTEERDGEIYVVESTIGHLMRAVSFATETVAELDVGLPILPGASRDFYYNWGIRDPDSSWLGRVLANIENGNVGFQRHLTDESLVRGYERGTPEYTAYYMAGAALDFLVPWEKYHFNTVAIPTRAVSRGRNALKLTGAPGFKGQVLLSGASPHLYSMMYRMSESVDRAADGLKERLPASPQVSDIEKLIANDDALHAAKDAGEIIDPAKFGGLAEPLRYTERKLLAGLKSRMTKDIGFERAIKKVKSGYTPDVFETVGHAAETVQRSIMDSPDGGKLLDHLPPHLVDELRLVLRAAGASDSEVFSSVMKHLGKSKSLHLAALQALTNFGDAERMVLVGTSEYKNVLKQVNQLLDEGLLRTDEIAPLMAALETRAYALAASTKITSIAEPKDFFGKIKIARTAKEGVEPGARWSISVAGAKKKTRLFSFSSGDAAELSSIFKSGRLERLLDNKGRLLSQIMGRTWTEKFFRQFDHKLIDDPAPHMPKVELKESGVRSMESLFRKYFIEQSGQIGKNLRFLNQLSGHLSSIWARSRNSAMDFVATNVRAQLDNMFSPDRVLKNQATDLTGRANQRFRSVKISRVVAEQLKEELPAISGRKRVYWEVDKDPKGVRQSLGIPEGATQFDGPELFVRAVGYTVGETFKRGRYIGGIDFAQLTDWTFATPKRARSIAKSVNAQMASVLGITNESWWSSGALLDAKKLKGMVDKKAKVVNLSDGQAAGIRVLARQLAFEPYVAARIPDELLDIGSDLTKLSIDSYDTLIKMMKDIEGGAFARRTHYSEAIPRSLGYAILNALKAGYRAIPSESLRNVESLFSKMFVLDDELGKALAPGKADLVRKWLKKLENVQRDTLKVIRTLKKEDPEAALFQIYDMLRGKLTPTIDPGDVGLIVGTLDSGAGLERVTTRGGDAKVRPAAAGTSGLYDLIEDFTESERARILDEFDVTKEEMAPEPEGWKTKVEDIWKVAEEPATQDAYVKGIEVPTAMSKLELLLKGTTISEMHRLLNGPRRGSDGLTGRQKKAFEILETFRDSKIKELDVVQRNAIAEAFQEIQSAMDVKRDYILERGTDIYISLLGEAGLSKAHLQDLPAQLRGWFYTKFYQGGDSWKEMAKFVHDNANELGLRPDQVPKYSMASAFLQMLVRMRAMEVMDGFTKDMVRHGIPVNARDIVRPRPSISPSGGVHAADIGNKFHERVEFYIRQIMRFGDVELFTTRKKLIKGEEVTIKTTTRPLAPPPEAWAVGEKPSGPRGRYLNRIHDFQAYSSAVEILAGYGHRFSQEGWEQFTFPDGSKSYVPGALASEFTAAMNRAAQIGTSRGVAARLLGPEDVGIPLEGITPEYTRTVRAKMTTGKAVDFIARFFPASIMHIKRGVTTGIGLPNPAYFTANFIGGALQLFTGVGPIGTIKTVIKHPAMTMSVMSRLWADGDFALGNPIIIAKDGSIYTADQITDIAHLYGLKSSFIQAETQQTMAKDVRRVLKEKGPAGKAIEAGARWQDTLTEVATAIDDFYRVSVLIDGLEQGKSAGSSARLARLVAFDYSALTDFEKEVARNTFMFYSYMRKNTDLFFDTLLTEPSRIAGQLRLQRGVQQENLKSDPEIVLRNYLKERQGVGFKDAMVNTHLNEQWMYVLPPMPYIDAMNLPLNIIDSIYGDPEAQKYIMTRFAPWIQAIPALALQVDPFYGKQIDQYNRVPPFIVEWDKVLFGGMLWRALDISVRTDFDTSRRYVEGDENSGWYQANNGYLWWAYRNLIQIPGTGRSIDTLSYLDRANLGILEGALSLGRDIRTKAEELGIVEELLVPMEEGDTMGPRQDLTRIDELLGLLGIKPVLIPTLFGAQQRIRRDWKMQTMKEVGRKAMSDPTRGLERRYDIKSRK